jgi:hypothetical protein
MEMSGQVLYLGRVVSGQVLYLGRVVSRGSIEERLSVMSYGCSSFVSHRPMRRYLEGCGRKAKWGGKCPRKEGHRVSVCLPVSPSTISPLIFPMMLDSFFVANTTTVTTTLGHYS